MTQGFGRPLPHLAALALASFVAAGCQDDRGPELVSVHRLSPGRAARADRVQISGEGFPDGKNATVTLRGDLFRPGAAPERDVRIQATATPMGRNAVAFVVDAPLERRFVGRGDAAVHATFHGDVRVTFDDGGRGGMPIFGTAHDVVFDVLPTTPGPADGDGVSQTDVPLALGFVGAPEPTGMGLRVSAVAPDGRGASAGLRPGDVVLSADGVTVIDGTDLMPEAGKRSAALVVLRDGRVLPDLPIDTDGIAPLGAAAFAWPAVALVVLVSAFALLRGVFGRMLVWMGASSDATLSGRRRRRPSPRDALRAVVLPIEGRRELALAASLVSALLIVGFVRLAVRRVLLSPDLDLLSLALSASVALLGARFADGGASVGGRWSLVSALAAALRTAASVVTGWLALLGAVVASGRFVLAEVVADQGATPVRWALTRNPGLLVLGVLLLVSALPETGDDGAPFAATQSGPRLSRTLVRLAEWTYLWVSCALFVTVFLGGYRLPGVLGPAQESSPRLVALGALFFVAKVGLVGLLACNVRDALGRPSPAQISELAWKRGLPTALGAVLVSASWSAAIDTAPTAGLAELAARVSVLLVLALGAFTVASFARGRNSASALNPWL